MSGSSEPPKYTKTPLHVIQKRIAKLKQNSDIFDVQVSTPLQIRELELDSEGNRIEGGLEASTTSSDQSPPHTPHSPHQEPPNAPLPLLLPPPPPMALTIRQLSTSVIPLGGVPTGITYPAAAEGLTADFELKSGLLHRLPTFHGLPMEDPNNHLMEFQFICTSMKPQGADEHILKLKAFPFSLADKAKQWLYELPSGRITSWGDMMKAFLEKYFPTSRIIMLRKKISGIQQGQDESYADYYERFKSLTTQCPQHGLKTETLLTCFYDGLTSLERDMLDAASGGSFVDKEPAAGMILIENRALNQQQYGNSRSKITTTNREKVHEVSTLAQLEEKINKLTSLVSQGAQGQVMVCGVCSMQGHVSDQCPQLMESGGQEGVNAIGFQQGFQRPRNDPFSNTYNPGWRDHPNFRWKDNENVQNAPQGFQPRPQGFYQKPQPPNPTPFNSNFNSNASSSSNDELIRTLTKSTQALIAGQTHHGNQINAISTDVNEMKKQMSQVVEFMGKFHEQGKLPSGTIPNPHFEQAKVVTTRSGKTLVDLPKPPKKISTSILEEEEDPATSKAQMTSPPSNAKPNIQGHISNSFNSIIANPSSSPLPFPSRYAKSKKDEAEKAILETFKKVQINIPLLEAIKQIPKYAKFLK
ncbi:uncharacterized protein LOC133744534 [Rosa rugosa]|uniref:uncharacterized protein LOC133744534 n=1 Tax=Rosa rugosa TaxID=74645 RepID=UPI002B40F357|nr:uncharacterized protein LOC133744534 [Rosa rugosa]